MTYEFWVKLENFTNAREKQGACSQAKPKLPTGVEIWSSVTQPSFTYRWIPVVPGQAGGGSFKEKNYKSKKEFAYRMCARRPTSAMPNHFFAVNEPSAVPMVVMFCALKWSVLMSWCLLRGQVMWWSRHLMRCDGFVLCHVTWCNAMSWWWAVLLQYYSVLLQY